MKGFLKKLSHFWYYYKIRLLVAVSAATLLVFCLVTAGEKAPASRQAAVISSAPYSDEMLAALSEALSASYGEPVGAVWYRVTLGAYSQDEAVLGRLDLDLSHSISSILLLEDPAAFDAATDHLPVSSPVPVSSIDGLSGLGFDELFLVTRGE